MKKVKSTVKHSKKDYYLDQKFWNRFVKSYWEKKPLALTNVKSALTEINENDIFNLVVQFSNKCRKNKNASGFKLYIDGNLTYEEDVLQFLPHKKDKNFMGYHHRMSALFSDYCLVCDELLQVESYIRKIILDFTYELYQHIGFPNRFTEIGLYLGNYKKTPFGVHVDKCGVFSLPVTGVKKFRLWTDHFVQKHPELNRAFKYSRYNKQSQVITIAPGDLSYWPSNAWHIAESTGSFSATWSLGVWVDQRHEQLFNQTLNSLLKRKFSKRGENTMTPFKNLNSLNGEVSELPKIYLESIKVLQSLKHKELQEFFLKDWLVHISKHGFKNCPKYILNVNLNSTIKLSNQNAPVLWQKSLLDNSTVFIGFSGTLIETNTKSELLKLVVELNNGRNCKISQFFSSQLKQSKDYKNLQLLTQSGAFTLV